VSDVSPFVVQYGDDLELTCNESLEHKLGDDLHRRSLNWRINPCNGGLIGLAFAHHTTEYTCRLVRC